MLQMGILACGFITLTIGIAFQNKSDLLDKQVISQEYMTNFIIILGMLIFRGVFSLTIGPVTLLYIPEIV